jgi:uncharacterized beta barrel domain-containing protein DUF5777
LRMRCTAVVLTLQLVANRALAQDAPTTPPPRAPEGSRVINLPSTETPAGGTLGVIFTHRFSGSLNEADFHNFFTFDSSTSTGIGVSYSPLDSLELALDRSSSEDDYEFSAKYRLLPVGEGRRFGLAVRVGGNGRTAEEVQGDRYAFFAQGIASLALGSRVRLTAIPTYVSNTASFRDAFNVPLAISVALTRTVNLHGEFYPKNQDFTEGSGRQTRFGWIASIEKTVLRHRFAFTVGNLRATSVDQYTASDFGGVGLPRDASIGFNIVRQWKLK